MKLITLENLEYALGKLDVIIDKKVDAEVGKGLSTNDFSDAYKTKVDDTYTKTETDSAITTKIAEVVASAPEDFDTLKEIADWISSHADSASAMNSAIQTNATNIEKKVDKSEEKTYRLVKATTATEGYDATYKLQIKLGTGEYADDASSEVINISTAIKTEDLATNSDIDTIFTNLEG